MFVLLQGGSLLCFNLKFECRPCISCHETFICSCHDTSLSRFLLLYCPFLYNPFIFCLTRMAVEIGYIDFG